MATYSLTFHNRSTNNSTFILYQKDPNPSSGEYSLAWFAVSTLQNMSAKFEWGTTYGFVQAQLGELSPGVVFNTAQNLPADLSTSNAVTLALKGGVLQFSDQRSGPVAGSLAITNAASVPLGFVAEGIGMSDQPLFVVQGQPNMEVQFTPEPEYWIAFGDFVQGEVLDSNVMFGATASQTKQIYGLPIQVPYPTGVYAMTATLDQDNSWTIAEGE